MHPATFVVADRGGDDRSTETLSRANRPVGEDLCCANLIWRNHTDVFVDRYGEQESQDAAFGVWCDRHGVAARVVQKRWVARGLATGLGDHRAAAERYDLPEAGRRPVTFRPRRLEVVATSATLRRRMTACLGAWRARLRLCPRPSVR
jgi:hypothetical protein